MEEIFELEEELVEHIPVPKKEKAKILLVLDLIINIVIIVVLVAVVRKFLMSPFQVYGPSMCSTLNVIHEKCQRGFGEYLIVNKATYQNFFGLLDGSPKRGDIVVFRPQKNAKDFYIKRIIGLPGETVEIRNGKVFIEDRELPESYLNDENSGRTKTFTGTDRATLKVPEGRYLVLGDNRRESTDSRTCFLPPLSKDCEGDKYFLPRNQIDGKAWIVLWPFQNIRILTNPDYALAVK